MAGKIAKEGREARVSSEPMHRGFWYWFRASSVVSCTTGRRRPLDYGMELAAIELLLRDPDYPGVNFELTDYNLWGGVER